MYIKMSQQFLFFNQKIGTYQFDSSSNLSNPGVTVLEANGTKSLFYGELDESQKPKGRGVLVTQDGRIAIGVWDSGCHLVTFRYESGGQDEVCRV